MATPVFVCLFLSVLFSLQWTDEVRPSVNEISPLTAIGHKLNYYYRPGSLPGPHPGVVHRLFFVRLSTSVRPKCGNFRKFSLVFF
jgi:hypothetical protein